ncbi:hypothetical protein [Clostridioides difficile]|nr:hypothetical protein [Clostridioides difficile]
MNRRVGEEMGIRERGRERREERKEKKQGEIRENGKKCKNDGVPSRV